jgi:hypothetical protein
VGMGGDVLTADTLSKLCEHTLVPSMKPSATSSDTPSELWHLARILGPPEMDPKS